PYLEEKSGRPAFPVPGQQEILPSGQPARPGSGRRTFSTSRPSPRRSWEGDPFLSTGPRHGRRPRDRARAHSFRGREGDRGGRRRPGPPVPPVGASSARPTGTGGGVRIERSGRRETGMGPPRSG